MHIYEEMGCLVNAGFWAYLDTESTYRPLRIMYPVGTSKWPENRKAAVHVFLSPLTSGLSL